ncbi:Alpha/Beta hydrolase protein [Cristinia sonorae]|uniref:Alpha/Beta hydrolase protein n=1 Tax=Cristinia sonorae TaxID=1940300 RepID=A0A8K0UYY4_9AGAR|nr:Alpha/Beta hydrolase protein [Cristinia sonorae]
MDASLFKDHTTSRGIKYHYYYSPPADSKPTLLFLHGFPCTSYDWRKQVPFFKAKGFGLLIPDLLGYGGTDKPLETADYQMSKMAADLIELLDVEKVGKAIAVAHDWGSVLNSRLANYYQDRFLGFAFTAVGPTPPQPDLELETFLGFIKSLVGYETSGYWKFFAEEDSAKLVEDHHESFLSLAYTADTSIWVQHFGPSGALRAWLEGDKKSELAPYMTKEELEYASITLKNGYAAPTRWYRLFTTGLFQADDKQIPLEKYLIQKPVLFAGCKRDTISLVPLVLATIGQTCPNHKVEEFDADHWLPIAQPDEYNTKLLNWVESISA